MRHADPTTQASKVVQAPGCAPISIQTPNPHGKEEGEGEAGRERSHSVWSMELLYLDFSVL